MVKRVKLQSDNMTGQVLLLGFGYTAQTLLPSLLERGYAVSATVRDVGLIDPVKTLGVKPLYFNGKITSELKDCLGQADVVLSSMPPKKGKDPFLASVHGDFRALAPRLKWGGYLSATSVYGDRQGQWVFEDELLRPSTKRGRDRVEAELAWLETGWPVHIFRLAGLYGPSFEQIGGRPIGRNPFQKIKKGHARCIIKEGHVVNRVHINDVVSALLLSLDKPNPTQVYNIADGNPAPPQDVLNYAADLLGVDHPPQLTLGDTGISDMALSFYSETKRVDIWRAKCELNWEPKFQDYLQGLSNILLHPLKS